MDKLITWLQSGKYLPECMRDFHDQKDVFKHIHLIYADSKHQKQGNWPAWVIGHQYVIDWFLWYMASRGYTLQKTRTKGVNFQPWMTIEDIEPAPLPINIKE